MITARVTALDDFGRILEHVQRQSVQALNDAARVGKQTFDQQAIGITEATVVPAHGTHNGYASGLRARSALWRIFDKGSLGKRAGRLKRDRRKDSWTVRRGGSEYTAHRQEVDGKGIQPRNISNPTRTAGRKALIRGIHR